MLALIAIVLTQTSQHRLFLQPNLQRSGSVASAPAPVFDPYLDGTTTPLALQCGGDALLTEAPAQGITWTRASSAYCAKSDGTLVLLGSNVPRRERMGALIEVAATNRADTRSDGGTGAARDLTDSAWTVANLTCARTATGADLTANAATTCAATADGGLVTQTITASSSRGATSFWIRRRTGTGPVFVTRNNFTAATDISALLSSSSYNRVWANCGGRGSDVNFSLVDNCIPASNLSSVAANPTIGVKLGQVGDAVDIDFAQDEPWYNTSPMSGFSRVRDWPSVAIDGGLPGTGQVSIDWESQRAGTPVVDPPGNLPFILMSSTLAAGKNAVIPWFQTDTNLSGAYLHSAGGTSQLGPTQAAEVNGLWAGRGRNVRMTWSSGNTQLFTDGFGAAQKVDGTANTPVSQDGPYYLGTGNSEDTTLGGWLTRVQWTSGVYTAFPGSTRAVLIVGDGVTEANTSSEGQFPEQVLQSDMGGRVTGNYVVNDSASGRLIDTCVSESRTTIDDAVAYGAKSARRLVFQCGIQSAGDGAASVWGKIQTLVFDSIDAGVIILPSTITPDTVQDPFIQGVNTRMRNVMNDAGIPWCDTYHALEYPADSGILNSAYTVGDGLLLNDAGATVMANTWFNCGRDAGYW